MDEAGAGCFSSAAAKTDALRSRSRKKSGDPAQIMSHSAPEGLVAATSGRHDRRGITAPQNADHCGLAAGGVNTSGCRGFGCRTTLGAGRTSIGGGSGATC
jgi:hypothetical protein